MIYYPSSFPGGPDDTLFSKSESGRVDSELFLHWFHLKYAISLRPLLLIIDGH